MEELSDFACLMNRTILVRLELDAAICNVLCARPDRVVTDETLEPFPPELPVSTLAIGPALPSAVAGDLISSLDRSGYETVGELASISADHIANRFRPLGLRRIESLVAKIASFIRASPTKIERGDRTTRRRDLRPAGSQPRVTDRRMRTIRETAGQEAILRTVDTDGASRS